MNYTNSGKNPGENLKTLLISLHSEARITGIESVEQGYYRCATINPLAKKGSYVTVRATLPYS